MKWLIKKYMIMAHINSLSELSKMTGIQYQTLQNHLKQVSSFRLFEIRMLDDVLHFSDDDMLKIIRGGVKD